MQPHQQDRRTPEFIATQCYTSGKDVYNEIQYSSTVEIYNPKYDRRIPPRSGPPKLNPFSFQRKEYYEEGVHRFPLGGPFTTSDKTYHRTDGETQGMFEELLKEIDMNVLIDIASTLRDGMKCEIVRAIKGGYNMLLELKFQDGHSWMARFPYLIMGEYMDDICLSEVATYRHLKENTSIPVPFVFGFGLRRDGCNPLRLTYMLVEKMPGGDLGDVFKKRRDEMSAAEVEACVKRFMEQLVDIILELSKIRFKDLGSLMLDQNGEYCIAQYLDQSLCIPPTKGGYWTDVAPEPFPDIASFYKAVFNCYREYFLGRFRSHHRYRDVELAENELIRQYIQYFTDFKHEGTDYFVLSHDDLASRNMLVDDDFNITAIIDWPGTTLPLASHFQLPKLFTEGVSDPFSNKDLYLRVFSERYVEGAISPAYRQLCYGDGIRGDFEACLWSGASETEGLAKLFHSINGFEENFRYYCDLVKVTKSDWFQMNVPKDPVTGNYSFELKDRNSYYGGPYLDNEVNYDPWFLNETCACLMHRPNWLERQDRNLEHFRHGKCGCEHHKDDWFRQEAIKFGWPCADALIVEQDTSRFKKKTDRAQIEEDRRILATRTKTVRPQTLEGSYSSTPEPGTPAPMPKKKKNLVKLQSFFNLPVNGPLVPLEGPELVYAGVSLRSIQVSESSQAKIVQLEPIAPAVQILPNQHKLKDGDRPTEETQQTQTREQEGDFPIQEVACFLDSLELTATDNTVEEQPSPTKKSVKRKLIEMVEDGYEKVAKTMYRVKYAKYKYADFNN